MNPKGTPKKSDGDTRRLAKGGKLQILFSLRAFVSIFCSFRYHLGLCIRKFTKKCRDTDRTEISFRVSLSCSHT